MTMMSSMYRLIPVLVAVLAMFMLTASAADKSGKEFYAGQPEIPFDYAFFMSEDSGKIRLEVYYQVFNQMLLFQRVGGALEADYEVTVSVNDRKNNRIDSFGKVSKFRVTTLERAESRFDYRTGQANFDLSPGKYKIVLSITDNNADTSLTREIKINLKPFDKKHPMLSRVEFIDAIHPIIGAETSFDKAEMTIVPSVGSVFGGGDDPRLMFYLEIYPGREPMESVMVETKVRNKVRGMVYRDSTYIDITEPLIRQVRTVSLDGYVSGEYELFVTLRGRRNKKLTQQYREFGVRWTQKALLRHEYKKAIEQVSLIADSEEIQTLKEATGLENRMASFEQFWRARDPVPETPENEAKLKQDRYRRFTFIDDNEDGDYRLTYPYDGTGKRPDF